MSRYHAAHVMLSAAGEEPPATAIEEQEAIGRYRAPTELAAVRAKLRRLVEDAVDASPAPRKHREAVRDIILLKLGLVPDRAAFKRRWLAAGRDMPQFSAKPMDVGAWGVMLKNAHPRNLSVS